MTSIVPFCKTAQFVPNFQNNNYMNNNALFPGVCNIPQSLTNLQLSNILQQLPNPNYLPVQAFNQESDLIKKMKGYDYGFKCIKNSCRKCDNDTNSNVTNDQGIYTNNWTNDSVKKSPYKKYYKRDRKNKDRKWEMSPSNNSDNTKESDFMDYTFDDSMSISDIYSNMSGSQNKKCYPSQNKKKYRDSDLESIGEKAQQLLAKQKKYGRSCSIKNVANAAKKETY